MTADALRPQLVNDFEEARRFRKCQTGCRLVHDEDPGVERCAFAISTIC